MSNIRSFVSFHSTGIWLTGSLVIGLLLLLVPLSVDKLYYQPQPHEAGTFMVTACKTTHHRWAVHTDCTGSFNPTQSNADVNVTGPVELAVAPYRSIPATGATVPATLYANGDLYQPGSAQSYFSFFYYIGTAVVLVVSFSYLMLRRSSNRHKVDPFSEALRNGDIRSDV